MTILRFPILFTGANKAMVILGIVPSRCWVEVTPFDVDVRMTWAFHARIPIESITAAQRYDGPVRGWGAHGWRNRWLVNGSSRNIVELTIDPPARGRTLVFPLRLKAVLVSVVDPDRLLQELSALSGPQP